MCFTDYISGQLQLQAQEPGKVTGLQFFNSVLYNADNPVYQGSLFIFFKTPPKKPAWQVIF